MTEIAPNRRAAIRAALAELVAEQGDDLLSDPARMSNLIKDLLPDDQQLSRILVIAAEQDVAAKLREHVSQGMDASTATRLVATSFAASTMFDLQACSWVVGELAIAMGLPVIDVSQKLPPRSANFSAWTSAAQQERQPGPPNPAPEPHPPTDRVTRSQAGLRSLPRRRPYLPIAVATLVVAVAAVTLAIKLYPAQAPAPSHAPPQGNFVIDRQIFSDGSLVLTLTTIKLRHNLMTVHVTYHNTSDLPEILSCLGDSDPSTSRLTLANGSAIHSTATYCSDHPASQWILTAGETDTSYAMFRVAKGFPQPFSFYWSAGSHSGTVSGIRI